MYYRKLAAAGVLFLVALLCSTWLQATPTSTGISGLNVTTDKDGIQVGKYLNFQDRSAVPSGSDSGGDRWYDATKKTFRQRTDFDTLGDSAPLQITVTDSTTLTNPTANTSFSTTEAVVATGLTAGKKLRVRARGRYDGGTAAGGATNANLSFGLEYNGVVLTTTGNVSTTANVQGQAWQVDAELVCRTAGASGTFSSSITGRVQNSTAITDAMKVGRAQGTIDTTAAGTVALVTKFSASNTAQAIAVEEFAVYADHP